MCQSHGINVRQHGGCFPLLGGGVLIFDAYDDTSDHFPLRTGTRVTHASADAATTLAHVHARCT